MLHGAGAASHGCDAQHQRAEPAKRLSTGRPAPAYGCATYALLARMPSAARAGGARQEKIAACDVFRELSVLVTQHERCSAGCRAQHQRAEPAKKKSQDAMFFVKQLRCFS
jgi:alkylhydroperoxidase family enzyme